MTYSFFPNHMVDVQKSIILTSYKFDGFFLFIKCGVRYRNGHQPVNHRMYGGVLMIRRMKRRTVDYHISTGRFSEDIEFETAFVYANGKIQDVNLGTINFERILNRRVKKVNKFKKILQLGFVSTSSTYLYQNSTFLTILLSEFRILFSNEFIKMSAIMGANGEPIGWPSGNS